MEDPDYKALTSMHFYSWQAGLKTGIYYLRRKPKHQPQQFTIAPVSNAIANASLSNASLSNASRSEKEEICEMCSA
jgi:ribonucleotide reductase alpha subunit